MTKATQRQHRAATREERFGDLPSLHLVEAIRHPNGKMVTVLYGDEWTWDLRPMMMPLPAAQEEAPTLVAPRSSTKDIGSALRQAAVADAARARMAAMQSVPIPFWEIVYFDPSSAEGFTYLVPVQGARLCNPVAFVPTGKTDEAGKPILTPVPKWRARQIRAEAEQRAAERERAEAAEIQMPGQAG